MHRHGGDEIFYIQDGIIRFHLDGRNADVGAGSFVVVPPQTEHGFKILTETATALVVGEIEMGEWVTKIAADGTRSHEEVRSTMMPWHRPPRAGEAFDLEHMMAMLDATSHVLDIDPDDTDDDTHLSR